MGPELAAAGRRPNRTRSLLAVWALAVTLGVVLVVYGFGPVFQARDQRRLLRVARREIDNAANESSGFAGVTIRTRAPEAGEPVGIIEIGPLRLQQAVVEGASSSQTRKGPSHVFGTAGLGQPGNSVIVGRAHAFGGPFAALSELRPGDRLLVTTTQGPSVYEVKTVRHTRLGASTREQLYGPSPANQLTLVTSASGFPWNRSRATVVIGTLVGVPFAPTPQNGRSDTQLGATGEGGASAAVILAMVIYGATLGASVLLYHQFRLRTAYILTVAPVMAASIIAAETLSRVFPAWT